MAGWKAFLETLVTYWRDEAPAFDAESLRRAVLALPSPKQAVEAVMKLEEAKKDVQPNGSYTVDFDSTVHEPAEKWLASQLPASLPILLLALRHPDHTAQARVEGILCEHPTIAALPALLSALESLPPNHDKHRSHLVPTDALKRLGKPSRATAKRLIRALDAKDFRIAVAAASVVAEFATDDELFEALWSRKDRADCKELYSWSLMRAAEVRRDPVLRPYLRSMLKDERFQSPGYPERIQEALDGLPKPAKTKTAKTKTAKTKTAKKPKLTAARARSSRR